MIKSFSRPWKESTEATWEGIRTILPSCFLPSSSLLIPSFLLPPTSLLPSPPNYPSFRKKEKNLRGGEDREEIPVSGGGRGEAKKKWLFPVVSTGASTREQQQK
jgi:hypothetical protein